MKARFKLKGDHLLYFQRLFFHAKSAKLKTRKGLEGRRDEEVSQQFLNLCALCVIFALFA
jgi:hypothetical protein